MRRFKNILFVINSSHDDISIERVVKLARKNEAKLTLLDVVEKLPTWAGYRVERLEWDKLHRKDIDARRQRLENAATPFKGDLDILTLVVEGKKFLETIRQVLRNEHDLVVKEAYAKTGALKRVFASEDMRLLRKCPCPVFLIKHGFKGEFKNIMATVDFDDFNDMDSQSPNNTLNTQIMDMSISLANEENSRLNVIHIYQDMDEALFTRKQAAMSDTENVTYLEDTRKDYESVVAKLLGRAKRRLGDVMYDPVNINICVLKGHPEIIIPEQAKQLDADLVVMGTVARTGISGFIIGNTAENILNDIECSVLALKPDGFISPVTLA